jgi:predicted aldo/keto reductase-like oxidoreductase
MKKLGFGCMRLPLINKEVNGSIDYEQTCKMFDYFIEKGFTYFETAYMYHDYQSERFVKKCLVERHDRNSYTLTSKLPLWECRTKEDMLRVFNEQLEKTGVTYFDYYMCHNLTKETIDKCREFKTFDFLRELKAQGKIKYFGISSHDTPDFIDMILTENPDIDFVQLQINYLDWNHPRIASKANYEVCVKHNKPVIVMEPVKGGALANVPEEVKDVFAKYDNGMSIASYAVRFCAELENVMVILSGMSNFEQVVDNISYMDDPKPLTDEENMVIQTVVGIMNKKDLIQCTKCNYCIDGCPQNIDIPKYFALRNQVQLANGANIDFAREDYETLKTNGGSPTDCVKCYACESVCPQHLTITKYLKDIGWYFEK